MLERLKYIMWQDVIQATSVFVTCDIPDLPLNPKPYVRRALLSFMRYVLFSKGVMAMTDDMEQVRIMCEKTHLLNWEQTFTRFYGDVICPYLQGDPDVLDEQILAYLQIQLGIEMTGEITGNHWFQCAYKKGDEVALIPFTTVGGGK